MNAEIRWRPDPPTPGTGTYCESVGSWMLVLVAIASAVAGALITGLWMSHRKPEPAATNDTAVAGGETSPHDATASPRLDLPIEQLLSVLPGASLLVDGASGTVERATPRAVSLGLVSHSRVSSDELLGLITEVQTDGVSRQRDIMLRRYPTENAAVPVRARAAALTPTTVLVLVEDHSGVRRVDTVRRDFVANVSHELKTPIGALMLLSEALSDASEDPDAVRRFSDRIQAECQRLTRLVADLIDLSRLQGDEPLQDARRVLVDDVVEEAIDAVRTAAATQQIDVVVGGVQGLSVYGVEDQLVAALRNLLANAIAYSQPKTRVAVGVAAPDGMVSISVKDQGIGIASAEIDRIFERFYRVDPARSRITGGTGLGLSLVKHICHNHGGEVTVWSVPGEGSTFSLRLPQYRDEITSAATSNPPGRELEAYGLADRGTPALRRGAEQ